MKTKFALFLDTFLISFIMFLIIFFWITKLTKNAILSIFLSILASFCTFAAIFMQQVKKYNLSKTSLLEQKKSRQIFLKLKFMEQKALNEFFEKLLGAKNIKENFFENEKAVFYVLTRLPATEYDFMKAIDYSTQTSKRLFFVCHEVTESFTKLLDLSPVKFEVFSYSDLYLLMKQKNIFPPDLTAGVETKKTARLKTKLKSSVERSHFKDFFFSGVSLIVISIVIPFSTYYLIFGSILLVISLICLFFKSSSVVAPAKENLSSLTKDADN